MEVNKMKRRLVYGILGAVFIVAVLLVSQACARRQPVSKIDRVRLQLDWKVGSEHAFVYLGQAKGFFKEQGIELEIIPGKGSSDSVNMVAAEKVEFAFASGEAAMQGRCANPPRQVKVLAVFFPTTPTSIYSLASKGIRQPKDLYGKRVGVMKGSSAYKHYQAFIKKLGLDASRIKEIPSPGSIQEIIAPNAQLDAMVHFSYQHPLQLRLQGYKVNEIMLKDYGVQVYGFGLITSDSVLEKNKELARRFTQAILKSMQYTLDHPDEALKVFLERFPEQEPKYSEAKLNWVIQFIKSGIPQGKPLGYQDIQGWEATMNYLYEQKLVDRRIDVREAFTTEFLR
jgi:NitT/TauT family transport system substrate-binding protein